MDARRHRIVHLTSVHAPDDIRIFHKECRTLASAGFDVTLIAPSKDGHSLSMKEGVRIRTIPKPTNRRQRLTSTTRTILRCALVENGDAYHLHDPELLVVGLALKGLGKHVVYDVHEDMPRQVRTRHYIPNLARGLVGGLVGIFEYLASRIFDGIAPVTETIARRFPSDRTVLVQNFPMLSEFSTSGTVSYKGRESLAIYVGTIEKPRGAQKMVEAISHLPSDSKLHFSLAGRLEPVSLLTELQSMPGWERSCYLGWQSRAEVASLLGRASLGVVVLQPVENYLNAQPIKLFEYMAAGLPVVASDFPSWREIIGTERCGLLVDPTDPTSIADAMQWLVDHPGEAEQMGIRGRAAVERTYHWTPEGERLLDFYRRLLNQ